MDLLVVTGFWPTGSNPITGIFVVRQVAAMARAGCRVTVVLTVTIGRPSSRLCSVTELGLDASRIRLVEALVLRLPEKLSALPGVLWLNSRLYGGMLARRIRRLAADARFDGCIVHGARYVGLSLPWWRHWIRGKAVIVMHGVDPFLTRDVNRGRCRRLFEMASAAADSVVLVGSSLWEYVLALGVIASKINVVANGTDEPATQYLSDAQRPCTERRRVVSVSNLVALKGIHDNLHALASIASRRPDLNWEYRIVGDGVCRKELELLTRQLGIADRVHFVGRLSHAETMREMADADIFSLPSWGEAFGIVYLEAMARMRPVIGCLANGAADIITDGQDGVLVQPRDVSALVVALEKLIADPVRCRELGTAARKTAARFSWDENVRQMFTVLDTEPRIRR